MRYQVYAPIYSRRTHNTAMVCIAMFNNIGIACIFKSAYETEMHVSCIIKEVLI